MGAKIGGWFLVVTGALACPCHLVVTLPLLGVLLGGTALGAFLASNPALVFIALGAYFVVGLALGYRLVTRTAPSCAAPAQEAGLSCERK